MASQIGKILRKLAFAGLFTFLVLFKLATNEASAAMGASLSSDGFRILDPQHSGFGGTSSSSSSSFMLLGTVGDIAIGSASALSFGLRSGFLYFPQVISATLTSATPGDSEVSLTWLAAQAFQGLSVSGYNVCAKPASGSYTCQDIGNFLVFLHTGLTNGTNYTFKIQARDAFGNAIGDSNELSAVPSGPTPTPTPSATPSSGGGSGVSGLANVILSGYAYSNSDIQVLRNAQLVGIVRADNNGNFSFSEYGLAGGNYKYSLYGIDRTGLRSATVSVIVSSVYGSTSTVPGIVIPPTMMLASDQLTKSDILRIRGYSYPGANVSIDLVGDGITFSALTGVDGFYEYLYSVDILNDGIHWVRGKTILSNGLQSPYSTQIGFGINTPFKRRQFNIPKCGILTIPDLNCDGRVNIVDVSIMMYYFRQPIIPGKEYIDFNGDGHVDIVEFSIMVYYWTG